MKIRKLQSKDFSQMCHLMLALYSKWDRMDPIDKIDKKWFCSRKHYNYLKGLCRDKNMIILVAEEDSKIVSYMSAEVLEREPFLQKVGHLLEAYTLSEYRGRGIANRLLNSIYTWFKEKKIKWYTASTHSLDDSAILFWEKRGFKEFNKNFKKIGKCP